MLVVLVGCAGGSKRSFDVTVENRTKEPIILWLTKSAPPFEEGWKSPERLAVETPQKVDKVAGVVVEPGQTAQTGEVSGTFAGGAEAILRVYTRVKSLDDILAAGPGASNRIDLPLTDGANKIAVISRNGAIEAVRGGK